MLHQLLIGAADLAITHPSSLSHPLESSPSMATESSSLLHFLKGVSDFFGDSPKLLVLAAMLSSSGLPRADDNEDVAAPSDDNKDIQVVVLSRYEQCKMHDGDVFWPCGTHAGDWF
jgi:hypothetical protein